jgi:hypothetical protein
VLPKIAAFIDTPHSTVSVFEGHETIKYFITNNTAIAGKTDERHRFQFCAASAGTPEYLI